MAWAIGGLYRGLGGAYTHIAGYRHSREGQGLGGGYIGAMRI